MSIEYKFCLLTLGAAERAEFICFATRIEHLHESERRFTLTADEIRLLNPNTRTCPVFRSQKDAELTKKLYRAAPVLIDESRPDGNPWGVSFMRMLDMSNDSGLFLSAPQIPPNPPFSKGGAAGAYRINPPLQKGGGEAGGILPLYEAKLIHQFDHRWATYEADGETARDVTLAEKQDPAYRPQPRYWVEAREVCRAARRT